MKCIIVNSCNAEQIYFMVCPDRQVSKNDLHKLDQWCVYAIRVEGKFSTF